MRKDTPARKKRWQLLGSAAGKPQEGHPQVVMVKREVKHLRRVPKRGEKARRHMSEALQMDSVSEKELEITRQVIEGVSDSSHPAPPETVVPEVLTFTCFDCGSTIPRDSVRCPNCKVLYLRDLKGEAIDEGPPRSEETLLSGERVEVFKEMAMAFAHFDMGTGIVTCLQAEEGDLDFGLECHNCGAVTQFGVDKCPLCGHSFDEWDTGLIGVLEGLKFDLDDDKELDCPMCGEHVVVDNGKCPSCNEIITYRSRHSPDAVVLPVLREKDVVFVHFDILNENLWFAQQVKFRRTSDTQTVHLESVGKSGFDHDWKSLARI